jgi:hypothetical protein
MLNHFFLCEVMCVCVKWCVCVRDVVRACVRARARVCVCVCIYIRVYACKDMEGNEMST